MSMCNEREANVKCFIEVSPWPIYILAQDSILKSRDITLPTTWNGRDILYIECRIVKFTLRNVNLVA